MPEIYERTLEGSYQKHARDNYFKDVVFMQNVKWYHFPFAKPTIVCETCLNLDMYLKIIYLYNIV